MTTIVYNPLISVIILNWNGKHDTLTCLKSLERVTYAPFNTIVIDNGSEDDSVTAIRSAFSTIDLVETGENLGFAGGCNVGIQRALEQGAELLLLLNNDTEVDPSILSAYVSYFQKHPKAGVVGGCPYLFDQRTQLDHLGGTWNRRTGRFDLIGNRTFQVEELFSSPLHLDYACGCALMIKRAVIETIGTFETKFFLFWEEADLCMRAQRAGFQVGVSQEAVLYHKVSASFVGKTHTNYFWWRNRLLWIERNCSKKETAGLYIKVIIPELFHLWKNHLFKTMQIALTQVIFPHRDQKQRREKKRLYQAALHGIRDYFFRRFGNGPEWIFKRGSTK